MNKPNCYNCVHRRDLAHNAHSKCNNPNAKVVLNEHGVKNGWACHPYNFDPIWVDSCDGFSEDPKENLPEAKVHPLMELFTLLGR